MAASLQNSGFRRPNSESVDKVLIIGSAPSATAVRDWDISAFDAVVAINNAWQIRPDWTHHIHPEDFPEERRPRANAQQQIITYETYVPAQNALGGFVYAGGTMAFTAGYWALHDLHPRLIAFMGCDMVYPKTGQTHFYGTGTADPLRDDPTLRDLRAKALRFEALAARAGCAVVNLSAAESVWPCPRAVLAEVGRREMAPRSFDGDCVDAVLQREQALGYFEPSGRYWDDISRFDPVEIAKIDAQWAQIDADTAP